MCRHTLISQAMANLGFMPPDLKFDGLEITHKNRVMMEREYERNLVLTSSDAHFLENIAEYEYCFDTDDKMTYDFLQNLCII